MTIEEIKKSMKSFRDFYGQSLLEIDQVDSCTTKNELKEILDSHYNFLEAQNNDAQCSLERYKKTLGLTTMEIEDNE